MIIIRKRLLYWVIKEYIKRSRKTISISFLVGIAVFFILTLFSGTIASRIPVGKRESIGIIGAYTLDKLPSSLLEHLSRGLTRIEKDGTPRPDVAKSWKIKDDGKTYEFLLQDNVFFTDGSVLFSNQVEYHYSDVAVMRPDKKRIIFKLKQPYAPFLVSVASPIFKKGFVGVSEYKIKDIVLNGNFVKSVTLVSSKNKYESKRYEFYPTENALKLALALGEVTKATGLTNSAFKNTTFESFQNLKVKKTIDTTHLATLFFNTQNKILSEKRLRQALSYALPNSFTSGLRAYTPYPETLWAYQRVVNEPKQDVQYAKLLLSSASVGTTSAQLTLELKSTEKYKETAVEIKKSWEKLNIKTDIVITNGVPSQFEVFLGDFNIPIDPDQYSLWHSNQENNITRYKNLRIDKLLEDGRKTTTFETRKKIYADFIKYLLDDAPASFLFFPYEYSVIRK